ncbi:MAG: electron transfer flavoprotein subunit alpha/FixB family protein [Candidatus Dormibacteraceae bacterium]
MAKIWVYAEIKDGVLEGTALELLTRARELGEVEAIALGPGSRSAGPALSAHGASRVLFSEEAVFADYLAEPHTDVMAALVSERSPDLVLFGFTSDSRDVAGRLAARLGCGLISNGIGLEVDANGVRVQVPYFGGAKVATYRANQQPALVLIRPRSFAASESGGAAELEELAVEPSPDSLRARIVDRKIEASERVKLEDAKVVVAGGRGLGGAENFSLLEDLAEALGGAVGASRAVVDAGWVPYSTQVGQTGKTVTPEVYIAAGISGAMQHTVGMKGSKFVIAINRDKDAPILKIADLGIVGDALRIVPQVTQGIRDQRGA